MQQAETAENISKGDLARLLAASVSIMVGVSAVLAAGSGWVRSQTYFFGPGAKPTPSWLAATTEQIGLLVLPYPIWMLAIVFILWLVDRAASWPYRVALASRFVLSYLCLWSIPMVSPWVLMWMDGCWDWFGEIWTGLPVWARYAVFAGGVLASVCLGLTLLVSGIRTHKRASIKRKEFAGRDTQWHGAP